MAGLAGRRHQRETAGSRPPAPGFPVPLDDARSGDALLPRHHARDHVQQVQAGRCIRWTGAQIEADTATAIRYLAPGLDRWPADLKIAAEARTQRPRGEQ
ncbi:hypothetical protein ABZ342_10745 [Amycolatopsis sp. NPDC005961]|uniref:hypothetical protein n=1 Tax=Amycolatopsis sp. NPDC005961 TaxID=3156720 RepID=UPI0033FADBDB